MNFTATPLPGYALQHNTSVHNNQEAYLQGSGEESPQVLGERGAGSALELEFKGFAL